MDRKMEKRFDHSAREQEIYADWESSGYFNPDNLPLPDDAPTFSMMLPPPNVTGTLHIGQAMMLAVEDIMVRYNRMKGKRALWLPGTDHAAIATQSKVERILYEESKKTKYDLGREAFLKRVEEYAQASHDTIVKQARRMGASLDWSREAYTLDEPRNFAVKTAFKRMYDAGLIYRGARIVNWDPKLQTTVSDDEVDREERQDHFYYLQYGPFVIATARPETKFGDKYVVMHPDDKRYEKYNHGDTIELEWINGPITATIIKDEAIDMEFGTGVMTITPWHDSTDFEISERHDLDKEQIIDFEGKLLPVAGEFAGMDILDARPKIIEKLKTKGLLVKTDENYVHSVAINSRGGGLIEPQIKEQWFVDVNKSFTIPHSEIPGIESGSETTLKEIMRKAVSEGGIKIFPERFEKIYFHWIDNLRDWCISRQIWYGHRIPVWYKDKEIYVGINPPEEDGWEQDPDTLDTWFSSGLWSFSTLGWPENTEDLKRFHPNDVFESGYDILFFWGARMILMAGFLLGQLPFKTIYLHGMVRDEKGRKMSKSLDNIIDPIDLAEEYGADAVRMSVIAGTGAGNDQALSEDNVRGYRNFTTKIWNITRFVTMNKKDEFATIDSKSNQDDQEALNEFATIKKEVSDHIDKFEFHLAAEKAYHYMWHTFADKIIENSKDRLRGDDLEDAKGAYETLEKILKGGITILHPFMPFITEAVYQELRAIRSINDEEPEFLMVNNWE